MNSENGQKHAKTGLDIPINSGSSIRNSKVTSTQFSNLYSKYLNMEWCLIRDSNISKSLLVLFNTSYVIYVTYDRNNKKTNVQQSDRISFNSYPQAICGTSSPRKLLLQGHTIRTWKDTFGETRYMKCGYVRDKHIVELLDSIRKELDILDYKLKSNNNSVIRDIAITTFLMNVLEITNGIMPYSYILEIEDK